jgi:ABC-type branched-subunit amino acid transport system ATPase component
LVHPITSVPGAADARPISTDVSVSARVASGLARSRRIACKQRKKHALVPQGRRVLPSLSVRKNLDVARRGEGRWSLEQVYALIPRLRERAAEQQMLAIGRALMSMGNDDVKTRYLGVA